jgi:hypothetical protein
MKLHNWQEPQWSQFVSQFNFKIIYYLGTTSRKLDGLTPISRDLHKEGDVCSIENQITIIEWENIIYTLAATLLPDTEGTLLPYILNILILVQLF